MFVEKTKFFDSLPSAFKLDSAVSNVAVDFPMLVKKSLNSSAIAKGFEITSTLEFVNLKGWRTATVFILFPRNFYSSLYVHLRQYDNYSLLVARNDSTYFYKLYIYNLKSNCFDF